MATDLNLTDLDDLSWSAYRALVEQVEDYAMFMLDLDGRVTTWNRGAQKIKQYEAAEIIGRHFSVFYPPEDLAVHKPERELEIALRDGHVEDEGWRLRRDGSRFWAFVSITLLRDERGRPRAFAKVTRDLSERRDAQEALRLSEERFRLLMNGVADYAIYMLDPNGIVTTWNNGAQKIKGYTAQDIIGKSFEVFFTPEDRATGHPKEELETALREGRFEEEGFRVRADGSHFWANVILTPLRDAQGSLLGFAKITRDLTARRREEQTRQERERFRTLSSQLETILEGVADGITVQDKNGKVLFANSAAARQIGVASRHEVVSADPLQIVERFEMFDEHGQPLSGSALPGRRVLAGEQQASALLRIRERATGRQWWTSLRANAVKGPDGKPEMAVNVWHDVTRERQREQHERYLADATAALSQSLDHQVTLEAVADLLVPGLCDWCAIHLLEGTSLRAAAVSHADPHKRREAREFQRQYPPDPAQPGGVWEVLRSGKPLLHAELTDEILQRSARDAEHLASLRSVGLRSVILSPITVRDRAAGALTLVSAESGRHYDQLDVQWATELGRRIGASLENGLLYRQAQDAARSAEAAAASAEAAGRMKDEFLATVSHELRTPLNAILGWSSVLKQRSDPATLEKGLDVILRNAKAQSKIIEDILDVSRIITGKLALELKTLDVRELIADTIEVVRPSAAARRLTVHFENPPEPHLLVADASRLQQVLWNLLSNAVKFSEPGGRVDIALEQEGSQLAISVSDQGRGIEPDFLPYVFERFKQEDSSTTRRYGGLGLGLAIVRHIVELHGGSAHVYSEGAGRGSRFKVLLPVRATSFESDAAVAGPSTGATPSASEPVSVNLTGVSVLVLDDERDARDLLELVLTSAGATVVKADSVANAFEQLRRFTPDVLVSDIGMPDEDGYSFIERVQALDPQRRVRAIALTAYARSDDRLRALRAGFVAHLGKPVNPNDLASLVARLARS
ncbi:MAG TPA: PAS domain S-box protein [Polyangiaceae bacterium]|nr:PAS domain S-box protein [Polyangiaceae bacterium]